MHTQETAHSPHDIPKLYGRALTHAHSKQALLKEEATIINENFIAYSPRQVCNNNNLQSHTSLPEVRMHCRLSYIWPETMSASFCNKCYENFKFCTTVHYSQSTEEHELLAHIIRAASTTDWNRQILVRATNIIQQVPATSHEILSTQHVI